MNPACFTDRFAGKVLVVTGAAQGIGRAVAIRAAREGGRVLFVDRADFVAEVAAQAGGETAAFSADLETHEGAAAAMRVRRGRGRRRGRGPGRVDPAPGGAPRRPGCASAAPG